MSQINDSKYHMMRGLIALAWADGELAEKERALVERYIEGNQHLTSAQRGDLKAGIEQPLVIEEVWEHITDVQDRARLIDIATAVFHADGVYSESERALYQKMMQMHLSGMRNTKASEASQEEAQRVRDIISKPAVRPEPAARLSRVSKFLDRINKAIGG